MDFQTRIRNFCIIAHIDHGKSTLADRLLELTGTIEKRKMKEQFLDQMDIERERGITIKMQPVKMLYQPAVSSLKDYQFTLNLIDTPGHVDFNYEVSRSLAAFEGAILLVDATQGVEAQTLANVHLAQQNKLKIIPVINKIDLPNADVEKTADEIIKAFGFEQDEILLASGKTGEGVMDILDAVVERIPEPRGNTNQPLRALIFDSSYDIHRGVIAFVRIVDGEVKKADRIKMFGTNTQADALEVGYFNPKLSPSSGLKTGEIGYIQTSLRNVRLVRVGDTVTLCSAQTH